MGTKRVRWTKFNSHFGDHLLNIYSNCSEVDVILIAEKKEFYAHKLVLSAASDFFREIFIEVAPFNTVPTLYFPEYTYDVVEAMIRYVYAGEITVVEADLAEFYKLCESIGLRKFLPEDVSTAEILDNKVVEVISYEEETDNNITESLNGSMDTEENDPATNNSPLPKKRLKIVRTIQNAQKPPSKDPKKIFNYAHKHDLSKQLLYKKYAEVVLSLKEHKCKHENLDLAVRACLLEGMSYRRSSEKYNVGKTVIYARAKEIQDHLFERLQDEVERMNSNKKAMIVSQLREKANDFKHRLQEALKLCRNGEDPEVASEKFRIPISSITRNLTKY